MFLSLWGRLPLGCRRARVILGGINLRSVGFQSRGRNGCFGTCSPGPVIGGKCAEFLRSVQRIGKQRKTHLFEEKTGRSWPNAELSARAKFAREYVVKQFWTSFVEV